METKEFCASLETNTEGTYSFTNEGHTLGNATRYFLIKK